MGARNLVPRPRGEPAPSDDARQPDHADRRFCRPTASKRNADVSFLHELTRSFHGTSAAGANAGRRVFSAFDKGIEMKVGPRFLRGRVLVAVMAALVALDAS